MNEKEKIALKRMATITELNDLKIEMKRKALIEALKEESKTDWSAIYYSLVGISIVVLLNYLGWTYWLEEWLR